MIRYLIVDDEPIAHRIIEEYASHLPHLEKEGNCYNAFEAMQLLNEKSVDLLFLDINMPKLSGFDFLKTLTMPPKIIVTTAYKEYALEGYELKVSDYLLKPFSFERFVGAINSMQTINRTPESLENAAPINSEIPNTRIFIKGDKQHHQIDITEILCIEAFGNYTKVQMPDQIIVSHEKISDFELLLPKTDFLRVHKSFIVALAKIKRIEGNRIHIESHIIPIGQTYRRVVQGLLR